MYAGPIVDTHMHLWHLANGYGWLNKRSPELERLIGNYDALRRNLRFSRENDHRRNGTKYG